MKTMVALFALALLIGCASTLKFSSEAMSGRFALALDCQTDNGEVGRNPLFCRQVLLSVIGDLRALGLVVFDVDETDPPGRLVGRLQEKTITHGLYISVHPSGVVNNLGVVSGTPYVYQTGDLPISCTVLDAATKKIVAMKTVNAYNRHHDVMMGRMSHGAHQPTPNYRTAASAACKHAIVDVGLGRPREEQP